jgi:hypothetical protein
MWVHHVLRQHAQATYQRTFQQRFGGSDVATVDHTKIEQSVVSTAENQLQQSEARGQSLLKNAVFRLDWIKPHRLRKQSNFVIQPSQQTPEQTTVDAVAPSSSEKELSAYLPSNSNPANMNSPLRILATAVRQKLSRNPSESQPVIQPIAASSPVSTSSPVSHVAPPSSPDFKPSSRTSIPQPTVPLLSIDDNSPISFMQHAGKSNSSSSPIHVSADDDESLSMKDLFTKTASQQTSDLSEALSQVQSARKHQL